MVKNLFKRNYDELKFVALIFTIWRISILVISYFAVILFEYSKKGSFLTQKYDNTFYQFFLRFDSGWYLDIAKNGYLLIENSQSNVAFFPLMPVLMKIGSFLPLISIEISGIILANLCAFLSFFVFYKLLLLKFKDISKLSLFLLIIFPSSFFLGFVYSESLFLFLTITAWYFAEKNKIIKSSICGIFAALTRPLGFLLFFPLLYKYYKEKTLNLSVLSGLLLIPIGIMPFLLYLYLKFNDFLIFQKVQMYWDRSFTWIWDTIFVYIIEIIYNFNFIIFLDLATLLIVIYLTIYLWIKVDRAYSYWVAIGILTPSFTGTLASINRYSLVLFPIFIAIAKILKNKTIRIFYYIFSISILIYLTARVTLRYWGG